MVNNKKTEKYRVVYSVKDSNEVTININLKVILLYKING